MIKNFLNSYLLPTAAVLLVALLFGVVMCASLSMGHEHMMMAESEHMSHAQSLSLGVVPLLVSLLALICVALLSVKEFSSHFASSFFGTVTLSSSPPFSRFYISSLSFRGPPFSSR